MHGREVSAGAPLAPRCWSCHGTHDIVDVKSPESRVARFRIPFVCGSCHKEGTPVTQTYDIPQDKILEHYSESMHGEGLFKRGLTVVAVCIDCHTSHNVLPHTDPRSSIFRDNIPQLCKRCHGQIEAVHRKVIRGELWEKEPNKVPICVDCHAPHKVRRIFYEEGIADEQCLKCHDDPDLSVQRDGKTVSLAVSRDEIRNSIHRNISCAKCHTGTDPFAAERPCSTVKHQGGLLDLPRRGGQGVRHQHSRHARGARRHQCARLPRLSRRAQHRAATRIRRPPRSP